MKTAYFFLALSIVLSGTVTYKYVGLEQQLTAKYTALEHQLTSKYTAMEQQLTSKFATMERELTTLGSRTQVASKAESSEMRSKLEAMENRLHVLEADVKSAGAPQ